MAQARFSSHAEDCGLFLGMGIFIFAPSIVVPGTKSCWKAKNMIIRSIHLPCAQGFGLFPKSNENPKLGDRGARNPSYTRDDALASAYHKFFYRLFFPFRGKSGRIASGAESFFWARMISCKSRKPWNSPPFSRRKIRLSKTRPATNRRGTRAVLGVVMARPRHFLTQIASMA